MSFTFGAPPNGGPPSENPGGPPKDEKTQLEEMTEKFVNLKMKYKEMRVQNEEMKRELKQTKDLLGSMTAPTVFNQLQKAGTTYIERHPLKYPKRAAAKAGLRPRSHLSSEDRRMFDAIAKQEYYDVLNDVDGNDRPNLIGILEGTDIPAADAFFTKVYNMMKERLENRTDFAAGGAAGGAGAAVGVFGSAAAYGVSGDPNVLFMDTDEEK